MSPAYQRRVRTVKWATMQIWFTWLSLVAGVVTEEPGWWFYIAQALLFVMAADRLINLALAERLARCIQFQKYVLAKQREALDQFEVNLNAAGKLAVDKVRAQVSELHSTPLNAEKTWEAVKDQVVGRYWPADKPKGGN